MKRRKVTLKDRVYQLLDEDVAQETIIRRILKEYPESKFSNAPVPRIYFYRCKWKQARAAKKTRRVATKKAA